VLGTNQLASGEDPNSFVDSGSFSRTLYPYHTGHKLTSCS